MFKFLLCKKNCSNPSNLPFLFGLLSSCSACISFSATGCAPSLSHFGSGSILWVRNQGLEETIRWLSVTDDGPVLIPPSPPSSPPILASTLKGKEKKQQCDSSSSCICRFRLGAGCSFHLFYLFMLLSRYFTPPKTQNKMEDISRILCYREWLRSLQFTLYLGWGQRSKGVRLGKRLRHSQHLEKDEAILSSHSILSQNMYLMSDTVTEAHHLFFLIIETMLPNRYHLHFYNWQIMSYVLCLLRAHSK